MRGFAQPISGGADASVRCAGDDASMNTNAQVIELADRRSDDFEVALLWGRRSGRLWVTVTDRASGSVSRIDATPANALDVFNHPFAYAQAA